MKKHGFTLIEVLITLALFALLMTMVTSAINSLLRFHRKGVEMGRLKSRTAEVLDSLIGEIASANEVLSLSGSTLQIKRADLSEFSASDTDVTVTWSHDGANGYLFRNSVIVAGGVKSIEFKSADTDKVLIDISIVLTSDIKDPNASTYTLNTSVCRRGTLPQWEFGP